jgi:hypothetical protein
MTPRNYGIGAFALAALITGFFSLTKPTYPEPSAYQSPQYDDILLGASSLLSSLTHYYTFDASNSNDSVGAANGSDTSVTYSSGNGKISVGGGVSSAGFINFGTGVGGTTAITYNMWIKPGTQSGGDGYYGLMGSGGASNNILFLKTNQLAAYINGSGGLVGIDPVATTINVSGTVWTMVTMTYDSTSGMVVYINGTSAGTAAAAGTANVPSNGFHVGVDPAITSRKYNGAFDEVGVWTRALTSAEVSELYAAGVGNQYPFGVDAIVAPEVIIFE